MASLNSADGGRTEDIGAPTHAHLPTGAVLVCWCARSMQIDLTPVSRLSADPKVWCPCRRKHRAIKARTNSRVLVRVL